MTTTGIDIETIRPVERAGRPWAGMGAIVLTSVAAMTPAFGTAALATPIEHGLGVSATGFGLALSGFFAASALGSFAAKRVAARLPVPVVLTAAGALALAALALAAAAGNLAVLALALLLAGAGNALVQPAAGRYIGARVPQGRLSLATGMVSAALGAAPLVPGLLAGFAAGPLGWRAALLLGAVLPVLAIPAAFLARTGPAAAVARPAATGGAAPVGRVLVLWTVAAGLATIGSNAAASFFVQLGTHSGLSTALAGLMQSLAGVVAVAVRLAAGGFADRAPRRNPALVTAMMLSGAAGLALVAAGSPAAFVAGALLAVAGGWGWTGLLLAAVMRLLPGQGERAGATVQIGLFGGAAVAPLAFGAASSALGVPATVLIAALIVLAGAASMLAGTAALRREAR
ncbi:MFS transporter [Actinomadura violacea]|uniref:MFS transporter n=1 Tax=Actinomadura violacea TaxID=2819934 RepID=A0ABS3RVH8_9ACTN|nr:MFS transporter [Actinomadura violacea]MBO2460752.1 MFS transporter [Actinomadura violacea]